MAHDDNYLWQRKGWPALTFDAMAVAGPLARARHEQGVVLGAARAIGLTATDPAAQDLWIGEALATAAIEGERLDADAVRSSVLRHLGLPAVGVAPRSVDGLVEVMQDALVAWAEPLDADRLYRWQAALFPTGMSGLRRIAVGRFRRGAEPMRIVSGPIGREQVHYEAPPAARVAGEMRRLIAWFNRTAPRAGATAALDGVVRAALAHLWFESIHPFEDGNGRVGRALADLALAQDLGAPTRVYSLAGQLLDERLAYYAELKRAQRGPLDVTPWVLWFVEQFRLACVKSAQTIGQAVARARYWGERAGRPLGARQRKALQRMLDAGADGFVGGMSAAKYAHLTGVSKATATRDLAELFAHGWLARTGEGRGTRYWIPQSDAL